MKEKIQLGFLAMLQVATTINPGVIAANMLFVYLLKKLIVYLITF